MRLRIRHIDIVSNDPARSGEFCRQQAAPGDYLGIFRDPAGVKFAVSSCDRNYDR